MEGSPALISIISPPFWISTPTLCLPSSKNWTKRMLCLNLDRMDLLELESKRRWFRRPNIKKVQNVHVARSTNLKLYVTLCKWPQNFNRQTTGYPGRFTFNQNVRKFGKCGKWYRNFSEKFPEIPKSVKFPKCKPFYRKFYKFREQS